MNPEKCRPFRTEHLGVISDVTAQKAMEKQLELAERLASLGTMAAGVQLPDGEPRARD